jgi:hypothetical protein
VNVTNNVIKANDRNATTGIAQDNARAIITTAVIGFSLAYPFAD